jgi:hypothetical protein
VQKPSETRCHLCALDSTKPALAGMFHKVIEEALEFRTLTKIPAFRQIAIQSQSYCQPIPHDKPLA